MKRIIEKIIYPYNKIKTLEKEIRNQDDQYTLLQIKLTKLNREKELLEEENKKLEEANTKHLTTLREQRKEIKSLQNEIKEIRANS